MLGKGGDTGICPWKLQCLENQMTGLQTLVFHFLRFSMTHHVYSIRRFRRAEYVESMLHRCQGASKRHLDSYGAAMVSVLLGNTCSIFWTRTIQKARCGGGISPQVLHVCMLARTPECAHGLVGGVFQFLDKVDLDTSSSHMRS